MIYIFQTLVTDEDAQSTSHYKHFIPREKASVPTG